MSVNSVIPTQSKNKKSTPIKPITVDNSQSISIDTDQNNFHQSNTSKSLKIIIIVLPIVCGLLYKRKHEINKDELEEDGSDSDEFRYGL